MVGRRSHPFSMLDDRVSPEGGKATGVSSVIHESRNSVLLLMAFAEVIQMWTAVPSNR